MTGVLSTEDLDVESLVEKARNAPGLLGRDLVGEVTAWQKREWKDGFITEFCPKRRSSGGAQHHIAAIDFGSKLNILRHFVDLGCKVTVMPARSTAEEIMALEPDGVFLSNGPGDPDAVKYAVETIKQLIGKKPMFGICMGHELLGLALGGRIIKLKFGHRGGNHPVMDLTTGKIDITAQNHGFAVDPDSLDPEIAEVTHVNLNDNTCEGLRMKHQPVFSVQHHPEASPGPRDANHHFERFVDVLAGRMRWW